MPFCTRTHKFRALNCTIYNTLQLFSLLFDIFRRSNLAVFLLNVSQTQEYKVIVIAVNSSLSYILAIVILKNDTLKIDQTMQTIPMAGHGSVKKTLHSNHTNHPNTDIIDTGCRKPSCLTDNPRKMRGLRKVNALVFSDRCSNLKEFKVSPKKGLLTCSQVVVKHDD